MKRLLLALACMLTPALDAAAQAVEHPEPFDSAGRVMAITPSMAARLQLLPPAWRITGQFTEARLFSTSDSTFIMVVTRPGGVIERYSVTPEERQYLRERTNTLPVSMRGTPRDTGVTRGDRGEFIWNQSILGLGVYAPAAAVALSDDGAGQTAIYLLVAGATYFGAATLSREITISEQQNALATHMATRGALAGLGVGYATNLDMDGRAAAILASSLIGTASGLRIARNLSEGETRAMGFAADATALVTFGTIIATDGDVDSGDDAPSDIDEEHGMSRAQVGALVGAGLLGYHMGLVYARNADYNITAGDVGTLWVSGGIGALAMTPFVVNSAQNVRLAVGTVTAGFIGGVIAGDRLFVRRADHSTGQATLVSFGAAAGALMGGGVYVLVDRDTRHDAVGLGLATLGAVGGVLATERAFPPDHDAGRMASGIRFNFGGALLAASGVRGTFPIVRVAF